MMGQQDPADTFKTQLCDHLVELKPELLTLSHQLHAEPELQWHEHQAVARITELLAKNGFEVECPLGGLATAFRAKKGEGSHRIGLVAEYDALEGLGHACGHNIIASAAVGAALSLGRLAEQIDATIEVIGTPAEEGGGGKIYLLDEGVFDHLDIVMMIHPGPADALWARPFAVSHFDISFTGHAAHAAAYPHLGINAADAMTLSEVAIALLRQQLPNSTRVHGVVREAGSAPNSIPDYSRASWYVRAADLEQLETTFERVKKCFEAGAHATGCSLHIEETSPRYSEFVNDLTLARYFDANAAQVGRDMDIDEVRSGGMNTASTDMGNVSRRVKAIHPYLSIDSLPYVNHQKEFAAASVTTRADETVRDGAFLLAATAIDHIVNGSDAFPESHDSRRERIHDTDIYH